MKITNELDPKILFKTSNFIYNSKEDEKYVLVDILSELRKCKEFYFSVAFITQGGLNHLKTVLRALEEKGIKGKLITTNYEDFTEPKALKDLMRLPNVEARMYYLDQNDQSINGFHTKGYIFNKGNDEYSIIIGSSNLTRNALISNKEWNQKIEGNKSDLTISNILNEFDKMWEQSRPISEIIEEYEKIYQNKKLLWNKIKEQIKLLEPINPNQMQMNHINSLNELIAKGEKRALLISATGTGKTYASAFGVREIKGINVKKLLYVTHRENILIQAEKAFKRVFNNSIKTTIFSGRNKDIEGYDFIFATTQLIEKESIYTQFKPDDFDFIILDEVHRVGDNKALNIINYFKPKFLLGMSATPDRTDNYDLYKLFDNNITYEIRLQGALEANMLVPFNYFGISDLKIDDKVIELQDFTRLTSGERVKHILKNIEYFGYYGNRVKGLMFVNSINVGEELSKKFNEAGLKTKFLSGSTSIYEREKCIEMLETDDPIKIKNGNYLDYILTVDIFNEGIDIPSINQVVMLRPTKSSIIFLQQLGRGLRKAEDKQYLNIIDFIGNYNNNFMIAKAFYSFKDGGTTARRIPPIIGNSVIQFDPISMERLFNSLDFSKINTKRAIYSSYLDAKHRLGKIPTFMEFYLNTDQDLTYLFKFFTSYHSFLKEKENEYKIEFNDVESKIINYFSLYLGRAKRILETNLFFKLLNNKYVDVKEYSRLELESLLNVFNDKYDKTNKNKYYFDILHFQDNKLTFSKEFNDLLNNINFKNYLIDFFSYILKVNEDNHHLSNDLKLYQTYTRQDVSLLVNSDRERKSTLMGYTVLAREGVLPCFITYHKKLKDEDTTNYEDSFINQSYFRWFSRHDVTSSKGEGKNILDLYNANKLKILLFVQKGNSKLIKEEAGFYYLGECKIGSWKDTKMLNGSPIMEFIFSLETPVRDDIYTYITSTLTDE